MNTRIKIISTFLLFLTSFLFSQEELSINDDLDSLKDISRINFYQMNELKKDWSFFNYPLLPYSTNNYFYGSFTPTLQLSSPTNSYATNKEEMLAQFRSQQNWETKKKFSVFTQYLGYAQFLGAMSLLGVHISQWYNLKNAQPTAPTTTFNRYDFK